MFPRKITSLVVLVAVLALAAPTIAQANRGGGPGHGPGADRSGASYGAPDRADVPSRVSSRLKRADRALGRAEDAVDDGDSAKATSALSSVRTNLASATKSANKRVSAGSDSGPAAAWAVTRFDHKVIDSTVSLFDGVTDTALVGAIEQTLDAAIGGRDGTVDAIAALPAADQEDYYYVLERIDDNIDDEVEAIDEALADDALAPEAQAALNDAKTQAQATQAKVRALTASLEASSTSNVSDTAGGNGNGNGRRDCPERENGDDSPSSSGSST
jgi:hypothetical protein